MTTALTIREGRKEDLPRTLELIKELATYERAPHEVINTVEQMERDGFGPKPLFGFFVRRIFARAFVRCHRLRKGEAKLLFGNQV